MSNDVKLELCPFCGGPAQIIAGAPGCYYVRCEGCSVTSDDGSRERVITKWNTRHQPQEREAVLEGLLTRFGLVLTDDPDFDHDEQTFEKAKASFVAALSTPAPAVSRDEIVAALTFIADLPDPGEERERTATFYRVHAAMLKQVAARALGRETVSQEALDWAEEWSNSDEGRAILARLGEGE